VAATFLLVGAVVYGTVGAVRSHQDKRPPLLVADTNSAPAAEPPAEAPDATASPNDSAIPATTHPAEQASPAESPSTFPSESASPAAPDRAATKHQHGRHRSHRSREAQPANRKTKDPVPWKVSF